MKMLAALALIGAVIALPAQAEETTLHKAIQAGTLHQGPLTMVAYWVELDGGAYELTATFAAREGEYNPMRVVMALQDGDAVNFAMPGYSTALYSFARTGSVVTIGVELSSTV